MPAQCFIQPSIQRSPQYTVHAAQAHSALTWFSPPVEAVARGVAAEQSPATWSYSYQMAQHLEDLQALHDNFIVGTVVATVEGHALHPLKSLDAHAVNTRTGSTKTTRKSATYSPRRVDRIKPTPTGNPPQQRPRETQDAGMVRKAEEIQCRADRNDMKNFNVPIKEVYDLRAKKTPPLLGSERTTFLTEKSRMLMS
ncbi:hypothetical protein SprV_0100260700 [Sparganum proliferum]